jgi:flagellar motor switch protein FliM
MLPAEEQQSAGAGAYADEGAMVPAGPLLARERMTLNPAVARLPVELDVAVPVREFRVRDLVNLDAGQVIATQWGHGEDMPLSAGQVQLAWSEFEVVDTCIAVRVTRLA